jgi:hypothetical protein
MVHGPRDSVARKQLFVQCNGFAINEAAILEGSAQNQMGCSEQAFDVCIGIEYHAENVRNLDIEWWSIADHGFSRRIGLGSVD